MDNLVSQQSKPAEQALLSNLSAEQLRLVASWLREELTLNPKEYQPDATRTDKRLSFIADRLENVAERKDAGKPAMPENIAPTEEEKPWRFSDEYWEKYESEDD
ncbi:MAG: hypothetical protein AAFP20_01685 [Cyanobacteria bacterium J06614_10]